MRQTVAMGELLNREDRYSASSFYSMSDGKSMQQAAQNALMSA